MRLKHLAIPQIHVHTARQTWIEASDRPHDVDAFEVLRAVFLEDRCVLHRVFVGAGGAKAVARVCVPGSWRIGMIVGDLVVFNHHVMRQHTANRLVEAAPYAFFGNLEVVPGFCSAGMQLGQCLFGEVQSGRSRIGLEVSASAIPFNRVTPFGNLPLKFNFGL